MNYTIDLEKLTDEQLEAFKVIDSKAYNNEKLNRSTYSDDEVRKLKIYTDLDKAYFYLKPMYDNMRNTDVKKTITESGILTVIEKMFRYCKVKGMEYEKFQPVVAEDFTTLAEAVDKKPEQIVIAPTVNVVTDPENIPTPVEVPATEAAAVKEEQTVEVEKPVVPTTVENMTTAELNKIMESIPAVTKI